MWTDKRLESLIPIAEHHLTVCRGKRAMSKILTQGGWPVDQYIPIEVWRQWSLGVRAYYVLLYCGVARGDTSALYYLCSKDQAVRIYAKIAGERLSYNHELTRGEIADIADKWAERAKKRQQKQGTKKPQRRGWTRDDVPAEYFNKDTGEPTLDVKYTEYYLQLSKDERAPGPVRRISPEEYLATKREPVYGGVKPEFAKESEHFAKERPDPADKYYDGTPLDVLIGQSE